MLKVGLLALLASLLIATTADAKPSARAPRPAKQKPAQFLGLRPHGPLATVRRGSIATPEEGACRKWAPLGSTWNALDRFGKIVGTAKVTSLDRYDVTNCDELGLERVTGADGAGVFVRGPYKEGAIESWKLSNSELASIEKIVADRDRRIPAPRSKNNDLALSKRMITFKINGQPPRAIVGGRAMTVFRFENQKWIAEHQEIACANECKEAPSCEFCMWSAEIYQPVAVLDMNGDGLPEIVVHEAWSDSYGDATFTLDSKGDWKRINAGIHGAFA